jgi:acetoin utilization protein AcuB
MKAIPNISKFMTAMPHTIGVDQTLAKAEKMMSEHRIRHLPVLEAGRLVGILSDRDIKLVETFKDVEPDQVNVEDAYTPEPFVVKADANLAEVCREMASRKYGCALVMDNNKLVGIFTWVDALNAMSELMETRLKH